MSLAEHALLLQAARWRAQREQEQRKEDMKQHAILLYNLSLQIGESVGLLFDSEKKRSLTPLSTYYPGLFDAEERKEDMSLETYTEMFVDFAERQNIRRHKMKGGDDHAAFRRLDEDDSPPAGDSVG